MKKSFLFLALLAFFCANANASNVMFNRDAATAEGAVISPVTDTVPDAIPYYIGVSSNPTEGGNTTGAGEYYNGQTCTLVAMPNQGFSFANWTEDGNPQTSNPVYTFTVTESRNLVANFVAASYTISAYADPYVGGSVTGAGTYGYQQTCTLTATANPGYTFVCWKEGEANVSNNATYSFTVTASRNLVAIFVQQTYVISVTVNPTDAGSASGAGTYNYGQTCTLTATPATGYDFVCWKEDGDPVSNSPTYSFTVTAARNLEAYFAPKSYVISSTVNPTESGNVTGTGTYLFNETCTLTATPNTGYVFQNWTENGSPVSSEPTYSFTVTGSRNLVANFTLASYEISVSVNPTIAGEIVGSGTYLHGQTCTLIVTEHEGYTFAYWSESGNTVSYDLQYSFVVTASRNLVANFTAMEYQVSVSANPSQGGVVDGGDTYYYGQVCTVTAEANTGYNFVNWTENGLQVASNSTYEFTVTANRDLVANFSANTYVISVEVDPEDGGLIEGAGGYEYGQTCTLTAIPNLGYYFLNWTEDGEVISDEEELSFVVEGSRSLVAHFEKIKYQVSIIADTLMGIGLGGGPYSYGDTCTIIAEPLDHYYFLNWTEEDEVVSTDAEYTFIVTENHVFVANFAPAMYLIDVVVNPLGAGTVLGTGNYMFGDTVTLCVEANEDYYFQNWTLDGVVVSDSICYTFVVEGPTQLVANFEYDDAVSESLSAMYDLYPNPASSKIQVAGEGIRLVKVFNVYGKLVDMMESNGQPTIELDVEHYASGAYILVLDTEMGTAVKRFVKQ